MAAKLRFLLFRVLLSVCVISFTILLLERGWKSNEDGHGGQEEEEVAASALYQNALAEFSENQHLGPYRKPDVINLAIVVCGDRLRDALVVLKSAIAFTSTPLHFIIFADTNLQPLLQKQLWEWQRIVWKKNVTHVLMDIEYPVKTGVEEWRKLFKPCASQRLFLPTLLTDLDSLIYVDTDVIFLRPLEDIWSFFYKMNSSQIAGLTPEHEDFTTGWYNRFAKHPFYGPLGVNSGVMLMNLTRMRQMNWQQLVMPIYAEYKLKITWGDQDIINIMFHYNQEKLYILPCEWNYRPDHCMYLSVCKTAERYGVSVLHGNRGVFRSNKQPSFRAVYNAFQMYEVGRNLVTDLLLPMKTALENTRNTNCGKVYMSLTKQLQKVIYSLPDT